ncbi:MAG: two-component regulator propeller domain-containing protein, partial [Bacteroidota bacterium]
MRVVRSNSLKIVFAWWVWACCYLIGYGQAELNRFRHISTSGDFTINPITDIQQDQRGHLWFGTRHGLLRHDGLQLRQYLVKNENAVRSGPNDVNEILIARSGKIWVATHDGLYLFDPVTLRFTRLDRQPAWQRAEINASTHSLLEARDGAIWVGTRTGLYRYSPGDDSVREVRTGGKNTGFVRVL